jgi:hypothetical protein
MPLTDAQRRDLVEHLATRVMEWHEDGGFWLGNDTTKLVDWKASPSWNPLEDPAAMMQVWEKAREMGISLSLTGDSFGWMVEDSGDAEQCMAESDSPCEALSLAVGRATGFVLEEENANRPNA